MSTTPRHASFREVADLVDGVLAGARRRRVEEHLAAGCATCDAALGRTRALVGALRAGPLPAPPAAVRRRAVALFGAARRRAFAESVREVLASLLVDQRVAPAAALRGAAGSGRRLLWLVPGAELVVAVNERGGRADLHGQVLPEDDTDRLAPVGSVRLLRDGAIVSEQDLDAEGEFALCDVPAGTYVLHGVADGIAFRTPPFVVG